MKNFIEQKLLAMIGNLTGIGAIQWLSTIDFNEFFKLLTQLVLAVVAVLHFIRAAKAKSLNDKTGTNIILLFLLSMLAFSANAQPIKENGFIYMQGLSIDSGTPAKHDSLRFRMVFFNNTADTLILSYAKIPIAFNSGPLSDSVPLKFKYVPGSAYRLPAVQKNNISTGISQQNGVLQITIPALTSATGLKVAPGDTVGIGIFALSGITRAQTSLAFSYSYVPNYFPLPQGKYYQLSRTPPPLVTMGYLNFAQNCDLGSIEWEYLSPGFALFLNNCQTAP